MRILPLFFLLFFLFSRIYAVGIPIDSLLLISSSTTGNQSAAKKFEKGFEKAVLYLTYMNYSDRPKERAVLGTAPYEPYEGRIIRSIRIRILKPYGTDVDNPGFYKVNKLQGFSNKIQLSTRSWVVKNDLQFEEGDRVKAINFSDTERLLWGRQMYKDLKIIIIPVEGSDEVDVEVVVRDRWAWRVTTNIEFTNVNVGVGLANFFGLPHTIYNRIAFNFQPGNLYTLFGGYSYKNIARSKINFEAEYAHDKLNTIGDVGFYKDFLSADDRWAGHVRFYINDSKGSQTSLGGEVVPTNVFYHTEDAWFAYSFRIKNRFKKGGDLNRIVLSARLINTDYLRRPFTRSADRSQSFFDNTIGLLSIGFSRWDYYFDRDVFYLGRGEYFPKGINAAIIGGWQRDEELANRMYTGIRLNYARYFPRFGYWYQELSYGGYTNFQRYQQILLQMRQSVYTNKLQMGQCHYRQFITLITNVGFDRPIGRENVLNDKNGLSGVLVNNIRGQSNIVLNLESAFYPTFKVVGVTSCVFAFADLALTNSQGYLFSESPRFYQSFGFGLRMRNQDFGWGFIELKFAYVPRLQEYGFRPYLFNANYLNSRDIPRVNLFRPELLEIDR